jgi:hypothetical protein
MRSGFPTPPEPTLGAPNLFILNDLLQYLQMCTNAQVYHLQEDEPTLRGSGLSLYTHYSADEAYPHDMYPLTNNVNEVPNFTACTNDNKPAAAKKYTHNSAQNAKQHHQHECRA